METYKNTTHIQMVYVKVHSLDVTNNKSLLKVFSRYKKQIQNKRSYKMHSEERKEQFQKYYKSNCDKRKGQFKEYYQKNTENQKEKFSQNYAANLERRKKSI